MEDKETDRISGDLKRIVIDAMSELKPRHREVLVMRCYEEMEYDVIAEELGCSQFAARVLFFRARNKLHKLLAKKGLKGFMN